MLIRLSIKAQKELDQLDVKIKRRLKKKLAWYVLHDDPLVFADALTDSELGQYRYRIGDYRLPFDVVGDTIRINRIGHRRDIYQ